MYLANIDSTLLFYNHMCPFWSCINLRLQMQIIYDRKVRELRLRYILLLQCITNTVSDADALYKGLIILLEILRGTLQSLEPPKQ